MSAKLPSFSSRFAFIMVTAGAAVGLGNVWAFPFVVGMNGGGSFIVIYLLALLLVATPVLMAELLLGRMGAASPPTALANLATKAGSRQKWSLVGWVGLVGTIVILSFYAVIAGQSMAWGLLAASGEFSGASSDAIVAMDQDHKATVYGPMLWHSLFLLMTTLVVTRDIRSGIERTGKYLMPALFVILAGLVFYASSTTGFGKALDFLFNFRAIDLKPALLIEAVGQAFFTLSVGVGGVMMFGAYMGDDVKMGPAVFAIVLMDLVVALLAGLAIFPLVFAEGMDPSAGPGLVFITLPVIFARITGGAVIGTAFFLLLTFAAITSAISLLAPTVQRLNEAGWSRTKAAFVMGGAAWLLGFATIFSFNIWQDWHPLSFIGALDGKTVFELMREGVSNIILPLAGVAYAYMVGWRLKREDVRQGLLMPEGIIFNIWYFSIRFIVPLAIAALFLSSLV